MLYQHPLAYLLGLEGAALMRAFNGGYDREFTEARIGEMRALLDSAGQFGDGVATRPVTTAQGYDAWAENYDEPNDLVDLEQPVVREILDRLPAGTPTSWSVRSRSLTSPTWPRSWPSSPASSARAVTW